ncbi:hypothetical protein DPMN_131199 [Dreissena polymorpha]|uniref:Uncharacterized protein n=1 Tax=Dreissena polymorpha TaxID=45954 RepID=A0A9D4JZ44_DREPO|nr:hypothetical protein DPMN_131199 [Dreissena polymorpha]
MAPDTKVPDGRTEGRTDGRTEGRMDNAKTMPPKFPSNTFNYNADAGAEFGYIEGIVELKTKRRRTLLPNTGRFSEHRHNKVPFMANNPSIQLQQQQKHINILALSLKPTPSFNNVVKSCGLREKGTVICLPSELARSPTALNYFREKSKTASFRTDGQTDILTDRQIDRQTNGQLKNYIPPFGGKKINYDINDTPYLNTFSLYYIQNIRIGVIGGLAQYTHLHECIRC